jgi:hypothetical protein
VYKGFQIITVEELYTCDINDVLYFLNNCKQFDLQTVPSIGEYHADRIIKARPFICSEFGSLKHDLVLKLNRLKPAVAQLMIENLERVVKNKLLAIKNKINEFSSRFKLGSKKNDRSPLKRLKRGRVASFSSEEDPFSDSVHNSPLPKSDIPISTNPVSAAIADQKSRKKSKLDQDHPHKNTENIVNISSSSSTSSSGSSEAMVSDNEQTNFYNSTKDKTAKPSAIMQLTAPQIQKLPKKIYFPESGDDTSPQHKQLVQSSSNLTSTSNIPPKSAEIPTAPVPRSPDHSPLPCNEDFGNKPTEPSEISIPPPSLHGFDDDIFTFGFITSSTRTLDEWTGGNKPEVGKSPQSKPLKVSRPRPPKGLPASPPVVIRPLPAEPPVRSPQQQKPRPQPQPQSQPRARSPRPQQQHPQIQSQAQPRPQQVQQPPRAFKPHLPPGPPSQGLARLPPPSTNHYESSSRVQSQSSLPHPTPNPPAFTYPDPHLLPFPYPDPSLYLPPYPYPHPDPQPRPYQYPRQPLQDFQSRPLRPQQLPRPPQQQPALVAANNQQKPHNTVINKATNDATHSRQQQSQPRNEHNLSKPASKHIRFSAEEEAIPVHVVSDTSNSNSNTETEKDDHQRNKNKSSISSHPTSAPAAPSMNKPQLILNSLNVPPAMGQKKYFPNSPVASNQKSIQTGVVAPNVHSHAGTSLGHPEQVIAPSSSSTAPSSSKSIVQLMISEFAKDS